MTITADPSTAPGPKEPIPANAGLSLFPQETPSSREEVSQPASATDKTILFGLTKEELDRLYESTDDDPYWNK